jgi:hypothetical protein
MFISTGKHFLNILIRTGDEITSLFCMKNEEVFVDK